MTIDEAFHRILRGHWLIILSCIVLPLSAAVLLGRSDADLYEAVARVQMGRDLAASNVQADATSQRVLGIATSPGVVRVALDKAGVPADVTGFGIRQQDDGAVERGRDDTASTPSPRGASSRPLVASRDRRGLAARWRTGPCGSGALSGCERGSAV